MLAASPYDEYAVVIPKFIDCIQNDKQPPIFGNGEQSRDFTFISNVVKANLLAATVSGVSGEVFNIACGVNNTVLNLVNVVNEIAGKSIEPDFQPIRQGDVFKSHANIEKAKALLGYTPGIDFAQGLKIVYDWFKQQK